MRKKGKKGEREVRREKSQKGKRETRRENERIKQY